MKQVIKLTGTTTNPDGSIEVNYEWNGIGGVVVYPTPENLVQANADLFIEPSEAIRWLMFYLLTSGATPQTLSAYVGKVLTHEAGPAVSQTITLGDA